MLYCYLRVNGLSCRYSDLARQRGGEAGMLPDSALTLVRLAAKHGVALRPVLLTIKELKSCAKPVIVHINGQTPEAGAFLLLLSITDEAVYYVNGASGAINSLNLKGFLRAWSGIALIAGKGRGVDATACGVGFSSGLLLSWLVVMIGRGHFTSQACDR